MGSSPISGPTKHSINIKYQSKRKSSFSSEPCSRGFRFFFTLSLNGLDRPRQGPVGAIFTSIFYGFPLVGFSIGLAVEVVALLLLVRGFTRAGTVHGILFALNIACNALMIFLFGIILAVCLLALMHVQPGLAIRVDITVTTLRC